MKKQHTVIGPWAMAFEYLRDRSNPLWISEIGVAALEAAVLVTFGVAA